MYKLNILFPENCAFSSSVKMAMAIVKRLKWNNEVTISNSTGLHPFIAECREKKGWEYWDEMAEMAENRYHNL